jgi:hypothetical protein
MAQRERRSKVWRRTLNWLGPVQRRQFAHNVWLELIVVGSIVLVVSAAYSTANVFVARHRNMQHQSEALTLARVQLKALQSSDGLTAGDQCFDTTGASHAASDAGAPCSYTPKGKSGCLSGSTAYCYEVQISRVTSGSSDSAQLEQPVTYQVTVSWPGRPVERGQVSVDYRVVESNSVYGGDLTGRSGSGGSGNDATIGVANGVVGGVGTTLGGKYINTLADIPGGPSVSVSTATCSTGSGCTVPKGSYDLSGHFTVSTNIPDKLITSCSWDFGDGTPILDLLNTQNGCLNGQIVNHSYSGTWQMRPLPEYPLACASPLGTSLNSYTFLASVTLHTTSGTDILNASSHYVAMPSCST